MRALRESYLCGTAQTLALGRRLGYFGAVGGVVYLRGGLGAGKTTFSRGVLSALGYGGVVRSPSYTLLESYQLAGGLSLHHLDCYRLDAELELEMLDLGVERCDTSLWLVEWPEHMAAVLPPPDLALDFFNCGGGRLVRWQYLSARGQQLARGLL